MKMMQMTHGTFGAREISYSATQHNETPFLKFGNKLNKVNVKQ
jgi:hypothetical protein